MDLCFLYDLLVWEAGGIQEGIVAIRVFVNLKLQFMVPLVLAPHHSFSKCKRCCLARRIARSFGWSKVFKNQIRPSRMRPAVAPLMVGSS